MAQERNEKETAHAIAVQSLKKELELAVKLLRHVKEARDTLALETHVVNSAREAFRHATEALDRLPLLGADDMQAIQRLMEEFRAALAELG